MSIENNKLPTPLIVIAVILICSCLIGILLLSDVLRDKHFDSDFVVFLVSMIFIHLVIAIAVLSKRRWGLFLFKGYLYLLSLLSG